MCGIAGIVSKNTESISLAVLKRMTDSIAHRGPDGDGHWISENGRVGFGHRRLAIIDLSREADQPMHYLDRYTIIFNGEIYNYLELKESLVKGGVVFTTVSDTEVIMAMFHKYREDCLQYLDGMFAFALFDKKENKVFIARDRFGEKPFYYHYREGGSFIFGSEMKSIWSAGVSKEVNNRMLYNYLLAGMLDNPGDPAETFYAECKKLPCGHYFLLDVDTIRLSEHRYYDIDWQTIDRDISEKQATERFHELFYTSVKRRLRSDVPVGSSLSGGLDSSTVVTVIDEIIKGSGQPQKTFSAVFPGFAKDESKWIKLITDATKVEPHFVVPDEQAMIRELEKLFFHQEEPFGSASIYVQFKVMELAKDNGVIVLLDGQGADEILAGYHGYYAAYFAELQRLDKQKYSEQYNAYKALQSDNAINKIQQAGIRGRIKSAVPGLYATAQKTVAGLRKTVAPALLNSEFSHTYKHNRFADHAFGEGLQQALYASTMGGSLQNLLRYADRNSMANSREVRLPFLNHELVEFIFSLPPEYKIRNGWTKWIMRQTFQKELPESIVWRKDKIGYEPPQRNWMENPELMDKIYQANKLLVENRIINKRLTNRQKTGEDAVRPGQQNLWGQLMAAQLFNSIK